MAKDTLRHYQLKRYTSESSSHHTSSMSVSTRRIHHRNILAASEGGENRSFGGYNTPSVAHNRRPIAHSTVVLDALNDEDSELARFLLIDNSICENEQDGMNEWSSNNINSNNKDNRCMGLLNTTGYSMALEPLEIRRERVIMLGESYSIASFVVFFFLQDTSFIVNDLTYVMLYVLSMIS